ncbi:MAG: hypothetical protein NC122_10080 [Faecalibacterium sp.]|nr:hypothetical protein [Ruminococcus sp.]MCM1392597.1 hypothetical protein [Ruminococcus sp.]MCM1486538.1 hypothetical protein [Faecalibacterium sp.]
MNENTIISLISLIGTLAGTFGGILVSSRLTNYRIEQLERKVEKHNSLIERTYNLEKNDEVYAEKFKAINHRIDSLESTRIIN